MTRDEILSQLVIDREYRYACDRISGYNQLAEELFQEMTEVMCRLDDERLVGLWERGEMRAFVVGILMKMWRCTSSPFYQRYRKPMRDKSELNPETLKDKNEEYDFEADREETFRLDTTRQILEEKENSEKRGEWYDAKIFEIYMKAGSARKAEREIGIPYRTIATSVRRTKMIIVGKAKLGPPDKE